ncbi:MAG: response regulator [Gammaproteobacteria bacterium]|nr:response regulator [Gammaproteobacteria bacterium]
MMQKTILITDDSLVLRTMLEAIILARWPDWRVLHAETGLEALAILKEQPVDCVTVDFHMPEMNGITFLQTAKAQYPDTDFIFITANLQENLTEALESMGVSWIHKPITAGNVINAIEKLELNHAAIE